MVITRLQGGLGNQLFQYALGRHVSLKLDTQLLFDPLYYTYVKNRHNILNLFQTVGRNALFLDYPLFFPVTLPIIGPKYQLLYDLYPFKGVKHIVEKKDYAFDSSVLQQQGDIYLDGFWQNPLYF